MFVHIETSLTSTASAVKRPGDRLKKLSSKQTSFSAGVSRNTSQNVSDEEADSFVIKRSNLSQQAVTRNAQRKAGIKLPDDRLPPQRDRFQDEGQPSYSTEALALLKSSTPDTPDSGIIDDVATRTLGPVDVAAKFGADYLSGMGGIPTSAEITERKERRARLAKEIKYNANGSGSENGDEIMLDVGLDSDDDEFKMQVDRVQLNDPRTAKYRETRLVHDDEDILEGFDEFTNDLMNGRIEIGRKAEKAAKKRAREHMRAMIAEAEGSESSGSDESERERREAYEDVQKRKAIGAPKSVSLQDETLPPRLPPIPTLGNILDKLRMALEETTLMRQAKQREIEEIEQERQEIAERESDVQRALKETAEQYQKLSTGAGLRSGEYPNQGLDFNSALAMGDTSRFEQQTSQRGLDNLALNGYS